MDEELGPERLWSLRALAQDAHVQRELYPPFVLVADELVLDFDDAFSKCSNEFRSRNPDLVALDAHIDSKTGILEYWVDDALESKEFWSEIRRLAKEALVVRGLSTFAPDASGATFVSKDGVWNSTGFVDPPASVFRRLMRFFFR